MSKTFCNQISILVLMFHINEAISALALDKENHWQIQAISKVRKGAILSPELKCITACIFIPMFIA